MISLADVIPALAILNLNSKTIQVIKLVIIPCFIYLILIGIIGMLIT
jgi:L-lactate permease